MTDRLELLDMQPEEISFEREVLKGLTATPKRIPPKFFYDADGSKLFEQITQLEEYYLTRTELSIIRERSSELSRAIGRNALLVEFGGGNLSKARLFLDICRDLSYYVAIDISRNFLYRCAEDLSRDYPSVRIVAICADFMKQVSIPKLDYSGRKAALFLGSSIGNFEPEDSARFFRNCSQSLDPGDILILGADNKKDRKVIEGAYNDSSGITAMFNMNLLNRINRELDGNIDLSNFSHRAIYDENIGRIEMHLVAREDAEYVVRDTVIKFSAGESIHTENSYKYSHGQVSEIASGAGFRMKEVYEDGKKLFSLYVLEKI